MLSQSRAHKAASRESGIAASRLQRRDALIVVAASRFA
jgi:hypothetical protein